MQIDRSDRHPQKADSPTLKRRLSLSKAKIARVVQSLKHEAEIVSIEEGMQREESENSSDAKKTLRLRTVHRAR
jgi:hypothetical protein